MSYLLLVPSEVFEVYASKYIHTEEISWFAVADIKHPGFESGIVQCLYYTLGSHNAEETMETDKRLKVEHK